MWKKSENQDWHCAYAYAGLSAQLGPLVALYNAIDCRFPPSQVTCMEGYASNLSFLTICICIDESDNCVGPLPFCSPLDTWVPHLLCVQAAWIADSHQALGQRDVQEIRDSVLALQCIDNSEVC